MNRWIVPGAVVGVVAIATVSATLIGAQALPSTPFAAAQTRVSVVCPGFESPTAAVRVAAVATGAGLRTAPVSSPGQSTESPGLRVIRAPGGPLRVSALLPDPFGASTVVAAATGADRGLSASLCAPAATEHWFSGVDIRTVAQSEVVVANLDGTPASVDLTVYGEKGRVAAPRGVRVDGNSVQTISLGTLERSPDPVTVEVGSGDGRVAAFVRQRTWQQDTPLGADWLPAGAAPATRQVVPGVPSGDGSRRLVLANPGDRTATVAVSALTTDGPGDVVGAGQLEVPPQSSRAIDLRTGLDGQPTALVVNSSEPVTAGMWLDAGDSDAQHDPAYTVGSRPLPSDAIWPVALGGGATTVLQLANPGTAEAVVTVTAAAGEAAGTPQEVRVPAGSLTELPLPRGATNVVRLQTSAADLRGALVSTDRLGGVHGLAVLDLTGDETRAQPPVVFDPRAGS